MDGLRAIAVLLVVFYHFGIQLGFYPLPGYLGVMIFFVLSGFLITWLLLRENASIGDISLKKFYLRRTLRIFPALYVYWIFSVVACFVFHKAVPWEYAIGALFYVANYVYALDRGDVEFMMQTWSLAVEEQFYLLWPLVFRRWRNNLTKLSTILMSVIGTVWIYRIVLRFGFGVGRDYLQYAFDCRMDSLFTGCLLAVLLKGNRLTSVVKLVCMNQSMPLFTIGILAMNVHFANSIGPNYSQIVGFPVEEFFVAVLLIQLIGMSAAAAWSWLKSTPMRFVGRLSYSLYLYHGLAVNYLPMKLRVALDAGGNFAKVSFGLTFSILAASVSYFVIERTFLRLKQRYEPFLSLSAN